ncbi:hypothetical protein LBMAG42_49110 [Deltaproteobacteria bacterium]|nr:hypothetical protein LBMAG42_49110 [Deltaproteobacteria bacterium]
MMLLLAIVSSAHAEHWWGVGPTIGTMGFPVEYPALMPALAQNNDGDNLVDPVLFDLRVGAHGVYYLGDGGRIGARLLYAGNFAAWASQEITVEYDWVLTKSDSFQVIGGGGLGFGHDNFGKGEGENGGGATEANLDVTYFPLRAQIGILWRDRTRAYEANLFGTWHIAGDQTFTNAQGEKEKGTAVSDLFADGGTKSDAALYVAVGAEVTVYFGNFKTKGKSKNDDDDGKKKKKKKNKD